MYEAIWVLEMLIGTSRRGEDLDFT